MNKVILVLENGTPSGFYALSEKSKAQILAEIVYAVTNGEEASNDNDGEGTEPLPT